MILIEDILNKGHSFCRAFLATIKGWPLLKGLIS